MLAGMGTTIADLSLGEILQPERLRELGYGDPRPSRGGIGTDWVRIAPRCYVRARRWQELSPRQQCLAMHLAFLSRTTAPWVFSDASAALLQCLPLLRLPDRVHVSSAGKPSTRDPQVAVHHRPGIGKHRSLLGGEIPVTDLPRTLLDCAASMGFEDAVVLADHVVRVGVASEDVLGLLRAAPGFRGARRVRRVLDFADARSESALESLARVAVHELRLPAPRPQMPVQTRRGRRRVDLGWEPLRMGLELDGKAKYFDYGDTRTNLYEERQRELDIQEAGVVLLRAGWADVRRRRPELKARLMDLAARRAAELGVPGWG